MVDRVEVIKLKIGILGTGAFGLALASVLYKNNNNIYMWSKFEDEILELKNSKKSSKLNDYCIPNDFVLTNNLEETVKGADLIIMVVPANFVEDTTKLLKNYYKDQHICIASKGIEEGSGRFLHDIMSDILNTDKIGVLSGPTFAVDLVNGVPAGVTVASKNFSTCEIIRNAFVNENFKISITDDMIGVSICGCVKNIMAIGAGIIDGMGYPISSISLLITVALKDVHNLIEGLGGNPNTILELSGIGDIILTCTSTKSRNYSFGKLIGECDDYEVMHNYVQNNTVEGYSALLNINKIVDNLDVNLSFISLMREIVLHKKKKNDLINYIIK